MQLFPNVKIQDLKVGFRLKMLYEINVRQIIIANGINSQTPKLQTALAGVLVELERNQKKENHLNTISNMMGTLDQAQLYTFSSRMASNRPQKLQKITV